jgi:hypothetical protein
VVETPIRYLERTAANLTLPLQALRFTRKSASAPWNLSPAGGRGAGVRGLAKTDEGKMHSLFCRSMQTSSLPSLLQAPSSPAFLPLAGEGSGPASELWVNLSCKGEGALPLQEGFYQAAAATIGAASGPAAADGTNASQ